MTLLRSGDVSQILFDGIQTKLAQVNPAKVKAVGDTAYARILAAFARKNVGLGRTYYEEYRYALDDLCDSSGVMAAGNSELVHFGRVHSHSSAGSDRRCADSRDSRTQSGPLRGLRFLERSFR
jgi:hypothetical protein